MLIEYGAMYIIMYIRQQQTKALAIETVTI